MDGDSAATAIDRLRGLIGHERSLREIAQALHFWAQEQNAAAVGALQVTCSDESESECSEAFHRGFVQYMLPALKFARHSAFNLVNPGGLYEWGAARFAEDHFVAPRSGAGYTLLVAKVNAHVALEDRVVENQLEKSFRLGVWERYGRDSACCGALDALSRGEHGIPLEELRETFASEGQDRLSVLQNPQKVDPVYRPLYTAVVSARLQARKIVLDIQDRESRGSTYWLVLPCVTVNRHERDTEILCGAYSIDGRKGLCEVTYSGLGDDPAVYAIRIANRLFRITDDQVGSERAGRDHRRMIHKNFSLRGGSRALGVRDKRLDRVRKDIQQNKHRAHPHARTLLRIALPILAEVAPVPAAILAFAQGAVGIHHAFRVHRLATEMEGTEVARRILDEIHGRIDQLDEEHAEALLELLMEEYSGARSA